MPKTDASQAARDDWHAFVLELAGLVEDGITSLPTIMQMTGADLGDVLRAIPEVTDLLFPAE